MGSLWLVRDRGFTNCVCSKPGRRNQLPALAGRARPSDSFVILFLLDPRLSRPLPNCRRMVPDEILTHLNVSLKQAELGRNGCCPPPPPPNVHDCSTAGIFYVVTPPAHVKGHVMSADLDLTPVSIPCYLYDLKTSEFSLSESWFSHL